MNSYVNRELVKFAVTICMTNENCLVSDERHAKMPEEKHCDDKYF